MLTSLKEYGSLCKNIKYTESQLDRIIQMAWEDRTPYYALKYQFNLSPNQLVY